MSLPKKALQATVEQALAMPESARVELIRGSLVQKAAPTGAHGRTQGALVRRVGHRFDRRPGGRWPGGWWFATEVDLQMGADLFRPDVVGWRRDRLAEPPSGRPVLARPDWICEILSLSTQQIDRVDKMQSYFESGVPHYWLLDPVEQVLEVYRREERGYLRALSAKSGQAVRAEPFDAVELRVDELFGADPEDD